MKNKLAGFTLTARYFLPCEIHFLDCLKSLQEHLVTEEVWTFQKLDLKCAGRVKDRKMFLGAVGE